MKWLFAATLGLALWVTAARCEAGDPAGPAQWQRQEMEFVYLGFTTRYSCEGLQARLRALLLASGARPDLQVTIRGCPGLPGEVTEFPSVHAIFYTLVGARGGGDAFPARWTRVTIAAMQPKALEPGDCELVEQFRDRVLPAFATRGLAGDVHCIPHQIAASAFRLGFESMRPASPESRGIAH